MISPINEVWEEMKRLLTSERCRSISGKGTYVEVIMILAIFGASDPCCYPAGRESLSRRVEGDFHEPKTESCLDQQME